MSETSIRALETKPVGATKEQQSLMVRWMGTGLYRAKDDWRILKIQDLVWADALAVATKLETMRTWPLTPNERHQRVQRRGPDEEEEALGYAKIDKEKKRSAPDSSDDDEESSSDDDEDDDLFDSDDGDKGTKVAKKKSKKGPPPPKQARRDESSPLPEAPIDVPLAAGVKRQPTEKEAWERQKEQQRIRALQMVENYEAYAPHPLPPVPSDTMFRGDYWEEEGDLKIVGNYDESQATLAIRNEDVVHPENKMFFWPEELIYSSSHSTTRDPTYGTCGRCWRAGPLGGGV